MAIDITKTINAAKILASVYESGTTSLDVSSADGLFILGYDEVLALVKTQEQSPLWNRYTDSENLVTGSDLGVNDDTWKDQGSEIDCRGYKTVNLYVNLTANNSSTNTLQVLCKHEFDGGDEYVLETAGDYQKNLGDFNKKIVYSFDVSGVPFIQIQTKAFTLGATEGVVTIDIVKEY